VGLAVGIVGVAAGVTLFVLSSGESSGAESKSASLVVGPGSVNVIGRM